MKEIEEIVVDIFSKQLNDKSVQRVMMNNQSEIMNRFNELESLPVNALKLCLPKRMSIDAMVNLTESIVGNMMIVIDTLIEDGKDTNSISGTILSNSVFLSNLRASNIGKIELENLIVCRRFYKKSAPIFTVRSSLAMKMSDINIGSQFPVELIRAPHEHVYFECCEAEDRQHSILRNETGDRIIEGAYISSFDDVDISKCSDEMIETLELERKKKTRKIEIIFSTSPYSPDSNLVEKVIYDKCESIFLYIQDEDEPLEDVINKHIELTKKSSASISGAVYGVRELEEGFEETVKNNVMFIMKVMAYINSDNPVVTQENEFSKILHSLKNVSNKSKLKKLVKKKNTAYDRIVLGPKNKYTPIHEFLDDIEKRTGIRPFYRRGTWGVRWTGVGRKLSKVTWIKPTIVNAPEGEDINLLFKDYLII